MKLCRAYYSEGVLFFGLNLSESQNQAGMWDNFIAKNREEIQVVSCWHEEAEGGLPRNEQIV